ncbi:MAG TPA: substrate-binding domain-containing protein [Methylomirabilota bacterium]|nr:substrate-binding domain-containing protein [Methylomirabilota bacterium]
MRRSVPGALGVGLVAGLMVGAAASASSEVVILSTTTSTQDSGLLDVLVPLFERKTGYPVKTIAVGTGQALVLAARGEADVTLVHAPALERKYLGEGKVVNRRLVMLNDFVIVGPPEDPARLRQSTSAVDGVRRIAATRAPFVSRGDQSGTHQLELGLWREAGLVPGGAWYVESGQGMGATLVLANDRRAYTLTDRATWLAFQRRVSLPVLLEGDLRLRNLYSVLEANPANGPRVNAAGGRAFADFLVSPEAQALIRVFGVERYGRPLFVPLAGKTEAEVGG